MSVPFAFDGQVARVLKGRLHNGRPQVWTISVKYRLANGEGRTLTVRSNLPAYLTELSPIIHEAIREESAEYQGVNSVTWTAMSR